MFTTGVSLIIVGLGVAAIGRWAVGSVALPLPGGWHVTIFPIGIGVLIVLTGLAVIAWSRVRSSG